MDNLTSLAIKYKADKWGKHHYTPVYYNLFKDRRDSVKKVIEIGTGEGASLFMWRDFFPHATIYGADNDKVRATRDYGERIVPILCDQTSQNALQRLLKITDVSIDLFVDDGSHKPEDQVFTFLEIFPKLTKGAMYVIEDVANERIINIMQNKCYMLTVGSRYDDRLIICQK